MFKKLKNLLSPRQKNGKPFTVGLALGGGGVRGLAHVGVLRVFERESIPINFFAGSSMGAIVAAAYGLNPDYNMDLLTKQVLELSLSLPSRLKEGQPESSDSFLDRLRQFINVERFVIDTVSGWGAIPEALVSRQLKKITLEKDLNEAKIPLSVVAVDLISGEKIVFKKGPAATALQASSAIPGFFAPVEQDNMLLADGAVVDVVPADVVREMGADIVIAVDVDQDELAMTVTNGLQAFMRAIELSYRHHKHHHLQMADLIIHPDFGEPVFTFEVSKAERCVEAGVRAAEEMMPKIRKLLKKGPSKQRIKPV